MISRRSGWPINHQFMSFAASRQETNSRFVRAEWFMFRSTNRTKPLTDKVAKQVEQMKEETLKTWYPQIISKKRIYKYLWWRAVLPLAGFHNPELCDSVCNPDFTPRPLVKINSWVHILASRSGAFSLREQTDVSQECSFVKNITEILERWCTHITSEEGDVCSIQYLKHYTQCKTAVNSLSCDRVSQGVATIHLKCFNEKNNVFRILIMWRQIFLGNSWQKRVQAFWLVRATVWSCRSLCPFSRLAAGLNFRLNSLTQSPNRKRKR